MIFSRVLVFSPILFFTFLSFIACFFMKTIFCSRQNHVGTRKGKPTFGPVGDVNGRTKCCFCSYVSERGAWCPGFLVSYFSRLKSKVPVRRRQTPVNQLFPTLVFFSMKWVFQLNTFSSFLIVSTWKLKLKLLH